MLSSTGWTNDKAKNFELDPALITFEQIKQHANNKKSLLHKIQEATTSICAPANRSVDEQDRQITNKKTLSFLKKEAARYRIQFSLGELNNLIDTKIFRTGVSYKYVVEPAFRNNEQLRKDIWTFGLGAGLDSDQVASVNTKIRITFSRFYSGSNAKWDAMKACPYTVLHTPMDSNDVKSKLSNGDGFRVEIIGNTELGVDQDIKAGIKTEALFLLDLYKLNNQLARMRLLGVKNKGEVSVGLKLKTDSPAGILGDLLTTGIGGLIRKNISLLSPTEKYPLDTMMVDYLFNFSTPDLINLDQIKGRTDLAEAAYEELASNINKAGFASLFFSPIGESDDVDLDLGNKLLENVKIAEDLAREDLNRYRRGDLAAKDMRVRSLFKGRMQSNLFAGEGKIWFSEIVSKKGITGNLDSFVTSYDENMSPNYYYLNNTFQKSRTRKYLGRVSYNYSHDLDLVVNSDKNRNVGAVADLVLKTEYRDTDLSAEEINRIKNNLARSLPENFKNNDSFNRFFPKTNQTNAFLSHQYVFGKKALEAVSLIPKENLGQMIYEYLNNHPEKSQMNLVLADQEQSGGLGTFAYEKAFEASSIVNTSADSKDKIRAFEIAKRDPIFDQYIVSEFFPSILPKKNAQELFGLNVKFSSVESGSIPDLNLGDQKISPVYTAVAFLKNVLSDRSFDLQLGTDNESPEEVLVPSSKAHALKLKALPTRIKP